MLIKNRLHKILLLFLLATIFAACQVNMPDLDMNTKKGLEDIKKTLKEKLGDDFKFVRMSIIASHYDRCVFEIAGFETKENHVNYMVMTDQINKVETSLKGKFLELKPYTFDDFKPEDFMTYKQKAVDMISEKTQDFIKFEVQDISYDMSEDGVRYCSFDLVGTKKDASPTIYGKRIVINDVYFSFDFSADLETGEVKCTDGLDN